MISKRIKLVHELMLLACTGVALASPATTEFELILRATNCVNVSYERGFDLKVLGWSFPVAKDYHFYGLDYRGAAGFQRTPESHPMDNFDKHPDRSAAASTLRQYEASTASILYYDSRQDVSNSSLSLEGFEAIEWRGLKLNYRAVARRNTSEEDRFYQLVIRVDGYDEELSISAGAAQLIADIVACAEET